MLGDPRFARASYALFAAAVLAALLKLGGITGAKPAVLLMAPAKPAAAKPAEPVESRVPDGPLPDWPEEDALGERPLSDFTPGGRFEGRAAADEDASVFRRPGGEPSEPVCGDLGAFPRSSRVVFPLPDEYLGSYEAGWGSPRPQGGHEGTDLMSPSGTPEFAVTDGTIVEVAGANENGWNRLGGYTVMLEAAYDIGPIRKGDLFYYAHMDAASTLPIGTEVRAGQQVGTAGDTGEGPEGTRGKFPSHLHLGWYDVSEAGSRSQAESGAMDPYPLLLWLEENGGAVSGGTDASYCEAPQGPVPASDSPGERPDMDTGNDRDARPSPVVEDNERRDRGEKRGQEGDGRAADPNKDETVGAKVPTPEGPPDRTTQPLAGGETHDGGVGNPPNPSPAPPDFDRTPLPAVPDQGPETTSPDDREDDEDAGGNDRNPPTAEDTNPDEEDEREERPDAEVQPGPAGEPAGAAVSEADPEAAPELPELVEEPADEPAMPDDEERSSPDATREG